MEKCLWTYSRPRQKSKCGDEFFELPEEYQNACRLCLSISGVMTDIFCDDSIVPLAVKLRTLLFIAVEEEDELPTMVCHQCLHQLNIFYEFKKKCKSNELKLRKLCRRPYNSSVRLEDNVNEDCTSAVKENNSTITVSKSEYTIDWNDLLPYPVILSTQSEHNKHDKSNNQKEKTENYQKSAYSESNQFNLDSCDKASYCEEDIPLENRPQISFKKIKKSKKCTKCKVVFSSKEQYFQQCIKCKKRFICEFCNKKFLTDSLLKRHVRTHTGEKPFVCLTCCRAFSQNAMLQRHIMNIHEVKRPFKCQLCFKGFGMKFMLNAHMNDCHSNVKYSCDKCPKVFKHASGLSRHRAVHFGIKYMCRICKKSFVDKSSHKRHLKQHPQAVHLKMN